MPCFMRKVEMKPFFSIFGNEMGGYNSVCVWCFERVVFFFFVILFVWVVVVKDGGGECSGLVGYYYCH